MACHERGLRERAESNGSPLRTACKRWGCVGAALGTICWLRINCPQTVTHAITKPYDPPPPPFQRAGKRGPNAPEMPPELAAVVAAWPHLPEAVKAGILAMVTVSHEY